MNHHDLYFLSFLALNAQKITPQMNLQAHHVVFLFWLLCCLIFCWWRSRLLSRPLSAPLLLFIPHELRKGETLMRHLFNHRGFGQSSECISPLKRITNFTSRRKTPPSCCRWSNVQPELKERASGGPEVGPEINQLIETRRKWIRLTYNK